MFRDDMELGTDSAEGPGMWLRFIGTWQPKCSEKVTFSDSNGNQLMSSNWK